MQKKIEFIGLGLGWFAIITQFILMIQNRQASIAESIIRFFSFFTILTNLLVTLFFTIKALNITTFKLFHKKETPTALTSFILIVGIVYTIVLRKIWDPKGLQLIVDELLHTVIPLYMFLYWLLYTHRSRLSLPKVFQWLLYPVCYISFILIRGTLSGFYPYPFLNVTTIGYQKTLLNIGIILVLILVTISILTLANNKRNNTNLKNNPL
ncbi:hypothetical protein DI487_15525 [Flavobacterium sediminis]|uniref:Pr6Pr family membrane protein n=1 Tax=Flavobacterium sediminis TaxID=2201181 RepID=A0A2U8QY83_9FLAO|nr:Pr6Pr family membrane protein [Flavobacterium sediminis]AWM15123.1 hypothetical protein DI487_15525 [Flavobacterium sediminis]